MNEFILKRIDKEQDLKCKKNTKCPVIVSCQLFSKSYAIYSEMDHYHIYPMRFKISVINESKKVLYRCLNKRDAQFIKRK